MSTQQLISIVIPALNEEDNIPLVHERLSRILKNENFEILFIDDGSTDGTAKAIEKLSKANTNVKGLSFLRNYGHQAALKAGFDHASGDCVITLDCDLEHPPEYITLMLQIWREGAEIVISTRNETKELPLLKRISSRLFYSLLNLFTDSIVKPGSADFRLLDRKVVNVCREIKDPDLFWRGIIPQLGFKITYFTYNQGIRTEGASKYTMARMLKLSLAGITNSSVRPLYLGFYVGASLFLPAVFYLIIQISQSFWGESLNWTSKSVTAAIFLVGGLQLMIMGTLGFYIAKLMNQLKGRPHYIVNKTIPPVESSQFKKVG